MPMDLISNRGRGGSRGLKGGQRGGGGRKRGAEPSARRHCPRPPFQLHAEIAVRSEYDAILEIARGRSGSAIGSTTPLFHARTKFDRSIRADCQPVPATRPRPRKLSSLPCSEPRQSLFTGARASSRSSLINLVRREVSSEDENRSLDACSRLINRSTTDRTDVGKNSRCGNLGVGELGSKKRFRGDHLHSRRADGNLDVRGRLRLC